MMERPYTIEVEDLRVTFAGGVQAVAGIDLVLKVGETLGLARRRPLELLEHLNLRCIDLGQIRDGGFEVIDNAAADVQSAIARVQRRLPADIICILPWRDCPGPKWASISMLRMYMRRSR